MKGQDRQNLDQQHREQPAGVGEAGTLASSVYHQIRRDILNGSLRPGEKLRSEFLRHRYQAGGSPVREALNRLSADGLVAREDQKGFSVKKVSREDLTELVLTRCWLEEIALRESIQNRTAAWEESLVLAFHRLSRVPRSSRTETYSPNPNWEALHQLFHLTLISACGSKLLLSFCGQMNDLADRYRQLAIIASYPKRNELEEHRAIMEAAINGQADEAVERIKAHYHRTAEILFQSGSGLWE
ncbi:MAG: GntR family transcriptional regulator [bacterium]